MNEILQVATDSGLDFFVVTDHDNHFLGEVGNHTWSDSYYNSKIVGEDGHPLIFLYGIEWTTAWGHATFFSDRSWNHPELYKLRGNETHNTHNGLQVAAKSRSLGLHFSPNHPNSSDPWDLGFGIGIDSLEVRGNVWAIGNDRQQVEFWEVLMDRGLRIAGRAGSDCHHVYLKHFNTFQRTGSPRDPGRQVQIQKEVLPQRFLGTKTMFGDDFTQRWQTIDPRACAIWPATRSACISERGSALPVPAISYAVP